MKKLLLAIMLIFPAAVFSQSARPAATPGPVQPAVRSNQKVIPKPIDVAVEGREIVIKGKRLTLPFERSELVKLLGEPSLKSPLANNIYTWDDYGVYAYERPGETQIFSLVIQLSLEDQIFDFTPKMAFTGKLSVDGAIVTADATIDQINKSKTGVLFAEPKSKYPNGIIKYENLEIGLVGSKTEKDPEREKLWRIYIEATED